MSARAASSSGILSGDLEFKSGRDAFHRVPLVPFA
jgi:hypothetical protein